MNKKDLSIGQLLTMGGALFSMHFGASCMLYPVQWGRDSGTSVFIAYIAIVMTALLLPLLAYIALARGRAISPPSPPEFPPSSVLSSAP